MDTITVVEEIQKEVNRMSRSLDRLQYSIEPNTVFYCDLVKMKHGKRYMSYLQNVFVTFQNNMRTF